MKDLGFDNRYAMWLCEIREWAAKHQITEEQAISVLFFDNTKGGATKDELYWMESTTFALEFASKRVKAPWWKRLLNLTES